MRAPLLLALILAPIFASAQSSSVRLSGGVKSENKLRRFVEGDARLRARLLDAYRREQAFIAESRESDLRDAVSDMSGESMRTGLDKSQGAKRRAILEALPGMKAAAAPVCRTIVDCPAPELAVEVADAERLPDALRRLVRPWMALQNARGSEIEVTPVDGPGDATLLVKLKDLDAQPLVLNVAPRLLGGFHVWFDRPFVLAALYGRERQAILRD